MKYSNSVLADAKFKNFLAIGIGLLLRIIGINSRPIWYDEAFALLFSPAGLAEMTKGTLTLDATGQTSDVHPLGYYFILGQWMDIFGESIISARILSIFFGFFTLIIIFYLANMFFNKEHVWIPLLLTALSPFALHYSQEIRMYSLMAFGLATATLALFKGMKDSRWGWWLLFAVSSAIAQYAQQLSAVYLISLALIPVFKRHKTAIICTVLGGFGAIILYLPWLINLPNQLSSISTYWIQKPLLSRFLTLFLVYVAGLPVGTILVFPGFGLAMVLIVFALISSMRIVKYEKQQSRDGFWFCYLAFFPPVLLWLISQIRPVYIERALLMSSIAFVIWVAWLVVHPRTPVFERMILVVTILAGSLIGFFQHLDGSHFPYAPYAELIDEIQENRSMGEVIVHSNKLSFLPMHYYNRDLIGQKFIADFEGGITDTLAPATQTVLGIQESENLDAAVRGARGVWFLIFEQAILEATEGGEAQHPHISWLDQHFKLVNAELRDGIWLMHYQAKDQ